MGIWPKSKPGEKAADGTDINACDRGEAPGGPEEGELLAVVDDSGRVKLFNWPCVIEHAPYRRMEWSTGSGGGGGRKPTGESLGYVGHSSHVVNVRFTESGKNVVSVGGHDRAIFQWRVDAEAVEQKGTTKRRAEPKPYIMAEPKVKAPLARVQEMKEAEEAAAAMSKTMDKVERQQRQKAAEAEKCDYVITVVTGDVKGASTQANVTFSAAGITEDGRTTVINQTRLDNAPNNFERGRTDTFKIRAVDLGTLKHVRIGHDNSGHNPGWMMESVSVLNRTKGWEHTMFPKKMWLDRVMGNETQITLYPTEAAAAAASGGGGGGGGGGAGKVENKRYVVKVTTADLKGSGTDANVYIEIVGESGKSSGQRKLDNDMNNFERRRVDRFEIEAAVGPIARIRMGHDNTSMSAAWCLAGVSIEPEGGKEMIFDVPSSGIWLEDGGTVGISTDLFPLGPDGKPKSKTVKYKIEVHTSDVKFAGTDANVSIEIIGAMGTSGKRKLATSRNNFERNAWDVFFIEMPDLGKLTAINIGHDNSGMGAAWHLDKVIVSDELDPNEVFVFPAGPNGAPGGRWLDKTVGDGLTTVTLVPLNEDAGVYYTIEVQTSDIKFSGTDANVSITLIGENKDGEETRSQPNIPLSNSKNNFERAELDRFEIGPVQDLGQLKAINIGHDGTGLGSGWHCEYVEVSNLMRPEERFFFPINSWFDVSEEPRQRRQTIKVAKRDPKAAMTTYKIEVNTSDVKNAGTDANVHIIIFGKDGANTGKVKLNNSKNNFERAMEDTFSVSKVPNVGPMSHIVIGHDEAYGSPSWHLAQVQVFNMSTGESLTFPADCWISKDEAPHYASEINLVPAGAGAATLCSYQISVRTSDVRFAGTDANVSCRLFGKREDGTEASTGEKKLENSKNNFERNKEDVFTVKDMDVGEITSLFIGHDGSGIGSDWHLSYVEVKNLDRPERNPVLFYHDEWLSNEKQQGVMLKPEGAGGSDKVRYRIVVHTSDIRFAGTDSTVTCKLVGELDGKSVESDMLTLENSANNFERGMVDEFVVQTRNVGTLKGVDIGIDGGGLGASWHLKMVSVAAFSDGRETFFYHENWLQKEKLRARLKASAPGEGGKHKYVIEVMTSDIKGSGTDANVSIVVFGDKGDTGEHKLDNSANNFERAMKDVFHVDAPDVGKIERVRIGHDNSGSFFGNASWHCASVEVTNTTTGAREMFSVNKWFALDKTPNQISQVLYPGNAAQDTFGYVVTTHTSDIKGAGTDANVTLELHGVLEGKDVQLGPFPLETSADDFKRGATDIFKVEGPKLGDLKKAIVAHDGKGLLGGADWHLQMIEVMDKTTTKKTSFWCDDWIKKNVPKEMTPSSGASAAHGRHRYKITVRTSDERGSGTDANVWIVVFGEKGDTGERKLDTSANNFERGVEDVFILEAPDLGEIRRVLIGHDNSGFGPGWKLEDVTVEDLNAAVDAPETHKKQHFLADTWLDKSKSPYQTQTEIFPSDGVQRAKVKKVKYTVTVHTSDVKNAGTDATVSVELTGDAGKMGWTKLPDGKGDPFERGKVDVFEIEGFDVGKTEKLGIKHDNKGYGPSWHLALVEVRNNGTGENVMFPCDNWLSKETSLERMLLAGVGEEGREIMDGQRRYRVSTVTSNKSYAGTDAVVFISVKGPKGQFTRRLEDKTMFGKRFEKGQEDAFTFVDVDVAEVDQSDSSWPIEEVTLGVKVDSMLQRVTGTDWHVYSVKIADVATGAEVVLMCDDWVKEKTPQTWRRSDPGPKRTGLRLAEESGDDGDFQYRVDITTGTRMGAGTDARVGITIASEASGSEPWTPMLQQNNDHFAKGKTDSFVMSRGDDFGELSSVTLTCDNGGVFGDSWYCEKVTVAALNSGREWMFHCGQWVGKEGVVLKQKVLTSAGVEAEAASIAAAIADAGGSSSTSAALTGPAEYVLTFTTGSKTGAGTDATVSIELIGANGTKSGDLTMDREPALFESKCVDSFPRVVEKDMGDLSEIFVWHDGKGGGMFGSMMSGWYLEKVVVENTLTERSWEADVNEWIYGKREKGVTKKLELRRAGLDADELRKKAEAARASVEELNNLRLASPRSKGEPPTAAAASTSAASDAASASTPAPSSPKTKVDTAPPKHEPPAVPLEPHNTLPLGKYEVTIKPKENTKSAAEGSSVPLRVCLVGRAGKADLTIAPGANSIQNGFIVASVAAQAVGDVSQVCVETMGKSSLSPGESFDIDEITVEALPEAKPHTVTFKVNASLNETHREIRVRSRATREQPAEEWEEAVASKAGVPRKYWFSKSRNASEWREPLKYYPVRFKERPKESDNSNNKGGGTTPGQTPRK